MNTVETKGNWKQNVEPEKADPTEHKEAVERPRNERKRKEKQNEDPGLTEPTNSLASGVFAHASLGLAALVLLG